MSDNDLDWRGKHTTNTPPTDEKKDHAAGARDVDMLMIEHADGAALVGYSYIRRIELLDGVVYLFASEMIFKIVSTTPQELFSRLQRHSLYDIKVGQLGVTHVTTKLEEDKPPKAVMDVLKALSDPDTIIIS